MLTMSSSSQLDIGVNFPKQRRRRQSGWYGCLRRLLEGEAEIVQFEERVTSAVS